MVSAFGVHVGLVSLLVCGCRVWLGRPRYLLRLLGVTLLHLLGLLLMLVLHCRIGLLST